MELNGSHRWVLAGRGGEALVPCLVKKRLHSAAVMLSQREGGRATLARAPNTLLVGTADFFSEKFEWAKGNFV